MSSKFPLVLQSLNVVSRQFKGCLKYNGSFKDVSSFEGVSRKFKGCFKEFSRVFQGSFESVLRKFQGWFKEVLGGGHMQKVCYVKVCVYAALGAA